MSFHIGKITLTAALVGVWLNSAPTSLGQDSTSKRGQSSAVIQKRATSKVQCSDSRKPQCAEEEFLKKGKPVMLSAADGIAFGVSSAPGKPTDVFVWMDNHAEETQSYYICCRASFLEAVAVFDSEGHRLTSRGEENALKARAAGQEVIEDCSCSSWVAVAPHTMRVVDYGNLSDGYALLPGSYFIVPVNPRAPNLESAKTNRINNIQSLRRDGIAIVIP